VRKEGEEGGRGWSVRREGSRLRIGLVITWICAGFGGASVEFCKVPYVDQVA